MNNQKLDEVQAYITGILASFRVDPADSLYQAGYEAAIKDVQQWIYKVKDGETHKTRTMPRVRE